MDFLKEIPMDMRPKIRYWLPAAAVDEVDLREEIRQLKARGFGGVEVVVLASVPESIAKGEDGWGREHWNQIVAALILGNILENMQKTVRFRGQNDRDMTAFTEQFRMIGIVRCLCKMQRDAWMQLRD